MNFIINRCRRKSPLQSLSASWLTTGKSHRCHHQHCHHLCRYIVYLRIAKTDNFPKRMREMFKPSMAELGLCMYQVFNIIMNISTTIRVIIFIILFLATIITIISIFQLDTLVQEHIPDLYVHFQSQVNCCQKKDN